MTTADNGKEKKQLKALLSRFAIETEVERSTEGLQHERMPHPAQCRSQSMCAGWDMMQGKVAITDAKLFQTTHESCHLVHSNLDSSRSDTYAGHRRCSETLYEWIPSHINAPG